MEPKRGAALLVVDDEEDNRRILRKYLEKRGHDVTVAHDGPQALALIRTHRFDLVLLDIMLPGLSGLEVLEEVRREQSLVDLPIIVTTALTDSADVVRALGLGANDYVTKPLDLAIVAARVQTHLQATRRPALDASAVTVDVAAEHDGEPGHGEVDEAFFADPRLLVGRALAGKYRIEGVIGTGGNGTVYRAHHLGLDQPVALKVLTLARRNSRNVARFQREAISACRVRHPNAVRVFDVDVTAGGLPYLVMELLTGHDLGGELSTQSRMPLARCAEVLLPVCDLLCTAHAAGIIHRDLKPANIFLHRQAGEETVKVVDFGLAKILSGAIGLEHDEVTTDGQISGTPAYIAPERWRNTTCTGSADVYSLGVILYRLLTGKLPFEFSGRDVLAVGYQHVHTAPQPLRERDPGIPEDVERLVLQALSKRGADRPDPRSLARGLSAAAAVPIPPSLRNLVG